MIIQKNCDFIIDSSEPKTSKSFSNSQSDVLTLSVSGANGVYYLEGRNSNRTEWVSLAGVNLNDFSVAKGVITAPGIYEYGVVGIRELRVRVESAEGPVTILGQLISTEET